MPDTLTRWHADHVNFGRLLTLLEGEFAKFHEAGTPDYLLMQDILYYLTHYSDIVHHPKEDLVFAQLVERESRIRPQVDELAAQHAQLKSAGDALAQALEDVVNGAMSSRDALEAQARTYVARLRHHMRIEEAEILPFAARLLDAQDWAAIDAVIARIPDPLFGVTAEKRYASLRRQIELGTA